MSIRTCLFALLLAVSLSAGPTTGEIHIAAILIKFQNDVNNTAFVPGNVPVTPQACRDFLFESPQSVNAFFQENSYGRLALTGDVFGPYVIPVDAPSAARDSACMCYEETIAAADNDIRFDQYDIILIIYPRTRNAAGGYVNYCGFQGAGTEKPITTGEGTFTKTIHWINGFVDLHIMAHEIGHYLGFSHANKLDCDECYEYHRDCHSRDAQDPFDAMGYSTAPGYAGPGHFNAYNKLSAGWLDEADVLRIDRSQTCEVTLTALESSAKGVKCVFLPFNKRSYYCLEFRQNLGFDAKLSPLNGLLIRVVSPVGSMSGTDLAQPTCGSEDLLLRPGRLFRDEKASVLIEPLEQTGEHMQIRILYSAFNVGASLAATAWPDSLSLGDTLAVPFTLYNDSEVVIPEPIYVQAKIKNRRGEKQDTVLVANGLGRRDSVRTFFKYLPQDGCGDYHFELNLLTPKGFSELYLLDNYLTQRDSGRTVIVLCDGPEFYACITTEPMILTPNEPVEILCSVQNIGQKDSGPFSVLLKADGQEWTHRFDNIAAGATANYSFQHSFRCGAYKIVMRTDIEHEVMENQGDEKFFFGRTWSDQQCDDYIMRPLFGYTGSFKLIGAKIFTSISAKEFWIYSFLDHSLQVIHSLDNCAFSSFDISNKYCVLEQVTPADTSILTLHNLETGTMEIMPAEHPRVEYLTINNDWVAWREGSGGRNSQVLYTKNLRTGEKKIIAQDVYFFGPIKLTDTNQLFWMKRGGDRDRQLMVMIMDLEKFSDSMPLPIVINLSDCRIKGNTIVHYEGDKNQIVWRQYDVESQTLSEPLRQVTDQSLVNQSTTIFDFDEKYLIYRNTLGTFLYSITADEVRCLSDIFGGMYDAYLRDDEIIARFWDYPWEYFIGSVKISDIQNIPVTVEKRVEENSALFTAAPNPFNRQTKITYQLANAAEIEIAIFNTMGQAIADYALGKQAAGAHSFVWDGSSAGIPVASGVYFCALKIDGTYSTTLRPVKVVLLK